ncbi:DNA-methyltransferase [Aneurinibacillus migulanus]|uniref:DNA-methyltransferase n=1 Tax=Aneurinibacillus migulanus TaxID=47500 RepID=UPI00209F64E2|nr:site-specific DNA-methyltransferase [Aneurinibacillus migulanus]MCP1354646.1 site-specific DNA-methyltransferase [Aneurinibacillus migulanus]
MTKKMLGEIELNRIYQRDCIEGMQMIPNKSIDMILCDLPYGTTACNWDTIIPFDPLWTEYERVIKDNGVIALTASQPFTTALIASNMRLFKYCWYWNKSKPNGFQHAKNRPMTKVEEVCIFSKAPMGHVSQLGDRRMRYNPQGVKSVGKKKVTNVAHGRMMGARPNQAGREYEAFTGFPHNVLEFANVTGSSALHPTQKPVELFEYLIKTYTIEGETVLDNCMGSGTTAVACVRTSRNFIGFETEPKYIEIANKRLDNEISPQ